MSALDFSLITSNVAKVKKSLELSEDSEAFVHAMLDAIYPTKEQENSELITDGPADQGIDAIYIRDREDEIQIDLLSFKYRQSQKSSGKNFESTEVQKIRTFISDLFDKRQAAFSSANAAIKRKCDEIWALFEGARICRFRVFLVSNGLPLHADESERFESFCKSYDRITYEQIDFRSVVRLLTEQKQKSDDASLKTVDDQIFDRADGDVRGVVANVESVSLLEAITDEKTQSVKRYLFDENIRVYLGDDGGYNKEIIASALADDNYLFWYLNNGITIVCDHFDYQKRVRSATINLSNFQVVNGAQTCNALFKAYQRDPDRVSNVLLLVKIFETRRKDVGQRVAISTNSQARINLRDLHSNDEIQHKIEKLLASRGLFYERKKNQHIDQLLSHRVDALKLGQMILSYKIGEPDKAKTESDSIFGARYNQIFNDQLDGEYLEGLIYVYSEIEQRRDHLRMMQRSAIGDPDENRFLNYGHWHILYAVSLMAKGKGISMPSRDEIKDYVDEAQELVGRMAREYKTVAYYDMFRSRRFWQKLSSNFEGQQMAFNLD